MSIQYEESFIHNLKRLSKKDNLFRKKVVDKINLFINDKQHPSLRLHKLQGKLKDAWSISVDKSIRILIYQDEDELIFVDIGSHDEVYK